MTSVDPESLKTQPQGRGWEMCLLGSVICLFVMIFTTAGCLFFLAKDMRGGQHIANLLAKEIPTGYLDKKEMTMKWEDQTGTENAFVGDELEYNSSTHVLKIKTEGIYYTQLQMALKCVGPHCKKKVEVTLHVKLTSTITSTVLKCHIDISQVCHHSVVKQCSSLLRIPALGRLTSYIEVKTTDLGDWSLDVKNTNMAIFLLR